MCHVDFPNAIWTDRHAADVRDSLTIDYTVADDAEIVSMDELRKRLYRCYEHSGRKIFERGKHFKLTKIDDAEDLKDFNLGDYHYSSKLSGDCEPVFVR